MRGSSIPYVQFFTARKIKGRLGSWPRGASSLQGALQTWMERSPVGPWMVLLFSSWVCCWVSTSGFALWCEKKRKKKRKELGKHQRRWGWKTAIRPGAGIYGSGSSAPGIRHFSPWGFRLARNRNCWVTGQDELRAEDFQCHTVCQ